MTITTLSGERFDIPSDFNAEITRYNPFFNEVSELSKPLSLPPTPTNMRLTGFLNRMDRTQKVKSMEVLINAGVMQFPANMVISGCDSDGLDCTLYPQDGTLYSLIGDKTLQDIFDSKRLRFSSVADAVTYCEGLLKYTLETTDLGQNSHIGNDEMMIFCARVDGFSGDSYRTINELKGTSVTQLAGRAKRTEKVDDKVLELPIGYGISPFLRLNYVLRYICEYFGFALKKNFLDELPTCNIAILNNNLDTIITGEIRYSELLPNMTVKDFLSSLLTCFDAALNVDVFNRTVSIELFRDLEKATAIDLTAKIGSEMKLEYPTYKRLKLSVEHVSEQESTESIDSIVADHPDLFVGDVGTGFWYVSKAIHPYTGHILRRVFKGDKEYYKAIGFLGAAFTSVSELEEHEVKLGGKQPALTMPTDFKSNGVNNIRDLIYIGAPRMLKSHINYSDGTRLEEGNTDLSLMMAYGILQGAGMTTNKGYIHNAPFSLQPNGQKGLYETFYRYHDQLLHNAMEKVTVTLNLNAVEKLRLSPFAKIMLNGQNYVLDSLTYTPDDAPAELTLYSLKELEPLITVPELELSEVAGRYWRLIYIKHEVPNFSYATTYVEITEDVDEWECDVPTAEEYALYKHGSGNYCRQGKYAASYKDTNGELHAGYVTIGFTVM